MNSSLDCKIAGLQDRRISGFQDFRITRLPDCQIARLPITKLLDCRVIRFISAYSLKPEAEVIINDAGFYISTYVIDIVYTMDLILIGAIFRTAV